MNKCFILLKKDDRTLLLSLAEQLGFFHRNYAQVNSNVNSSTLEENEFGIVQLNEWCMLVSDCNLFLEKEATPTLTEFSKGTEIFFVLTEDTSAGLWFEYHVDGQLLRKWVEVESKVAVNIGELLAQEKAGFFSSEPDEDGERDEWKLFDLCEQVTGISTEKLFSDCLTVYK